MATPLFRTTSPGLLLMGCFWFGILIAWLVRPVGLGLGGGRPIRNRLRLCMIGRIAGSVGAVLIRDVVGIVKIVNGYAGEICVAW